MDEHNSESKYPLFERLMREKGLPLKGLYSTKDAARILGKSTRTICEWVRSGKLPARDFPDGPGFLAEDFECFLQRRRGGSR